MPSLSLSPITSAKWRADDLATRARVRDLARTMGAGTAILAHDGEVLETVQP